MDQKFKLGDKEYDVENLENLSDQAKAILASLQFATARVQELNNMQALLQRAKKSYIETIKMEMVASKAGLLLGDD